MVEIETDDANSVDSTPTNTNNNLQKALPSFYPSLLPSLATLQLTTPTPIQAASAQRALDLENLLLIAATGSGKTMAYLLPVLERLVGGCVGGQQQQKEGGRGGTVLVVAPTRELALQLLRDTESILSNIPDDSTSSNESSLPSVLLAVKGVQPPTTDELSSATVLIGTPSELYDVLTSTRSGQEFIAGDAVVACVLDEVDVLFPNPPKELRTSLDTGSKRKGSNKTPRDERRQQEQKRKRSAAKRSGTEFSSSTSTTQIVGPTERLLKLIASRRQSTTTNGGGDTTPCQILAGSATASRKTLDRLNKALYGAAVDASSTVDVVWNGSVSACRPETSTTITDDTNTNTNDGSIPLQAQEHTIRTVTVPSAVRHQYLQLEKSSATSPTAILTAVSHAANRLKPQRALLFLCGEFSKSNAAPSSPVAKSTSGKRVKVRSSGARKKPTVTLKQKKQAAIALAQAKAPTTGNLSARTACSTLQTLGIDAKPLHVALGLETGADDSDESAEIPPFLVTFEGSARGLHFDGVDAVFIVGRPSSAASYLHRAGRFGRSVPTEAAADGSAGGGGGVSNDDAVMVRPGTVVSIVRDPKELEKWTRQIGGTDLEELVLED